MTTSNTPHTNDAQQTRPAPKNYIKTLATLRARYHLPRYPDYLSSDRNGNILSIEWDQLVAFSVPCLFKTSSPPHVAGLVVPALIWIPIDRMTRGRPLANVGQECLKVRDPLLAHRDAERSIKSIARRHRITAPLFHSVPYFVFWRLYSTAGTPIAVSPSAMFERQRGHSIRPKTPARF